MVFTDICSNYLGCITCLYYFGRIEFTQEIKKFNDDFIELLKETKPLFLLTVNVLHFTILKVTSSIGW